MKLPTRFIGYDCEDDPNGFGVEVGPLVDYLKEALKEPFHIIGTISELIKHLEKGYEDSI